SIQQKENYLRVTKRTHFGLPIHNRGFTLRRNHCILYSKSILIAIAMETSRMSKIALLIALAFSPILLAQSGTSTISGTIKDPSGAPIPTAKLKVVNQDTGFEAQTKSNESGIYRVGSLLPGTYRAV